MKKIIIAIVVLGALVGGYVIYNQKSKETSDPKINIYTGQVGDTKPVMEDGTILIGESGEYEDYNAMDAIADAEAGKVVLFFKAGWCPTCRAVDSDINSHLKNIPKGVVIMKVDYDNSTELKKKYGVTYQHTFVQIDKNGNMLTKWSGSPTLADIISKIK